MLEHTSVCMFACARMLITFSPIWMFTVLCVYCILYVCARVCVCVCVATSGSHLREWSAAACLSLAEAPEGRRIRERERARECSADESEATPHGPLGIYYNQ